MNFCTVFEISDGRIVYGICDAVDGNHRFGPSLDGQYLHVAGVYPPSDSIVAFGLTRGNMATGEVFPGGHPEGIPDAA